jgi:hypothetical protein
MAQKEGETHLRMAVAFDTRTLQSNILLGGLECRLSPNKAAARKIGPCSGQPQIGGPREHTACREDLVRCTY